MPRSGANSAPQLTRSSPDADRPSNGLSAAVNGCDLVHRRQKRTGRRGNRLPSIDDMTDTTPAGDNAPRSYLETPTVRPGGVAGKVELRAGSNDAVLAVVPHMLGFYPSRSLVVLGLGDRNRVRVTFRYDLPDPPDGELAAA